MARIGGPWGTDKDREILDGLKRNKCGNCRAVHYCNVACQHAHWKEHKTTCQSPSFSVIPSKGRMFVGVKIVNGVVVDDDDEEEEDEKVREDALAAIRTFVAERPREAAQMAAQTGMTRSGIMSALGNTRMIRAVRDYARRKIDYAVKHPFSFALELIMDVVYLGMVFMFLYAMYTYAQLSPKERDEFMTRYEEAVRGKARYGEEAAARSAIAEAEWKERMALRQAETEELDASIAFGLERRNLFNLKYGLPIEN